MKIARTLADIFQRVGAPLVFKASYDKANRTSLRSFRGPGLQEGLRILRRIKEEVGLPILTDVHACNQVARVAEVVDVLPIPAFLCRQTDLLLEVGRSAKAVNIKKGQFMAPWDMSHAVEKVRSTGNHRVSLTERGAAFGYNNLVVDFRSFAIMRDLKVPVVFDATHAVQLPGGEAGASGGEARFIAPLARAAVACGVDGLFFEVHDNPADAKCDGPNAMLLSSFEALVKKLLAIHAIASKE